MIGFCSAIVCLRSLRIECGSLGAGKALLLELGTPLTLEQMEVAMIRKALEECGSTYEGKKGSQCFGYRDSYFVPEDSQIWPGGTVESVSFREIHISLINGNQQAR